MNSESTSGLDPDGFIETRCAIENIAPAFQPVIDATIALLTSTFAEKLHSIYLYGSVAIGHAVLVHSDLDILVIFRDTISSSDQAAIKRAALSLSDSHKSLAREVGIGATSLQEALASEALPGIGCFFKHLCICIAGEDIRPGLPKFRPSIEVARGFNGDYAAEMQTMLDELAQANQPEVAQAVMRRICRKTVRTGFSLVMPRLGYWTTELEPSCAYFCRYYPDKCAAMSVLLAWIRQPPEGTAEFLRTLTPLADWLSGEFDRVIGR